MVAQRRPAEGRRVAVLVGCNYKGTVAELRGCVNDVWGMHATLLHRFHFKPEDIQVLVDNDPHLPLPTGANIRRALRSGIASMSGPGDVLFFHFSGHGTRVPAPCSTLALPNTPLDYDECIVPCDMNLLTDEDIREVVDILPRGATFTIIADSCHSGGLIRYEKEQIGDSFSHMAAPPLLESTSAKDVSVHQVMDRQLERIGKMAEFSKLSRSLPTATLVDILRKQTARTDINAADVRFVLCDMFIGEASIKFRHHLACARGRSKNICVDHEWTKSANKTLLGLPFRRCSSSNSIREPGDLLPAPKDALGNLSSKRDQAILISACQAYETAEDLTPSSESNATVAFGAMSHAILAVLSKLDGGVISNRDLVMDARRLLAAEGITYQHPGLYCCDNLVNAPFLVN